MGIVANITKRFTALLPGFAPGPQPGWPMTWWQEGRDLMQPRGDALACSAVRAAVDLISTTIATMPMQHRRRLPDGSTETVNGNLQRLLDDPVRDVLTSLDFLDWMTTQLLEHGNAFAFVVRDDVGRALELHPLPTFAVQPITADDGAVYYRVTETFFDDVDSRIAGEPVATLRGADVLHLRIGAHRHPLLGLSPLDACRAAVDLDSVIRRYNIAFHLNAARPSGAIIPDERLTTEQPQRLKILFASAASQEAQGSAAEQPHPPSRRRRRSPDRAGPGRTHRTREDRSMRTIVKAGRRTGNDPFLFILSDGRTDRMGDVVEPSGWRLESFLENPIALYGHDQGHPIGRWSDVHVDDDGRLVGRLELAAAGTSDRIDEIRALVEQGILRAVSVGFRPLKAEPISGGVRYVESELVEVSVVAVPANPRALATVKALDVNRLSSKAKTSRTGTRSTRSTKRRARWSERFRR